MKKFLPLIIVLCSIGNAWSQTSQLLTSENFTGYTNGNLNGQGGSYPWYNTGNSNYVQVAGTTPMFYPNYTSGSQYVNLTQKDDYASFSYPYFFYPDDPYKKFIGSTAVATTTNTTFFMSFVVRVPSNAGTTTTSNARPTVALTTSTGSALSNFYIADNGTALKFGINKDGSQDGIYASANYTFGSTYLVVMRYDMVTGGTSNDKMYMWINPSLASEPSTASADVTVTSGSDGGFSGSINSFELFQNQYSATSSFDGFKIAYAKSFVTSNSLAAWNALSPIGAPLPVKFGDVKGYPKGAGVQVDWSVYTELNVQHYDIERSTDGVSFAKAGMVIAQNADGTLYYDWFDAAPSTGNNFYRIKNVDIDGKSAYSPVIRVSLDKPITDGVRIYPNPVIDSRINFQSGDLQKGNYKIEIFNTAGQLLYSKNMAHGGGPVSQSLQLPAMVKPGIYNLRMVGGDAKISKSFLVK